MNGSEEPRPPITVATTEYPGWAAAEIDTSLVPEFLIESRQYLGEAESALLTLEQDPDDKSAVHTLFRAFHTIKGGAGFLGATPLVERRSALGGRPKSR